MMRWRSQLMEAGKMLLGTTTLGGRVAGRHLYRQAEPRNFRDNFGARDLIGKTGD